MAIDGTPRSVADATRFTANTPHANWKARSSQSAATAASSAATASSTAASAATTRTTTASPPPPPRGAPMAGASPSSRFGAGGGGGGGQRPESLEERVRRLRAAHLAARTHEMSKMDKVISSSRRYMDTAHKYTVLALIGFSGLALVVTAYASVDMMIYNRKRRTDFFALQQQLEADSLESARLAYMTDKATDEQIAMVEEAMRKAKEAGTTLPGLLGTAKAVREAAAADEAATSEIISGAAAPESEKKGVSGWLFGGLKKEDTAAGQLSFSKEEAAASGASALAEQGEALKQKAKAAFETEKENQRNGGPLDQIGLDAGQKKKGWFW